MEYVGGAGRNSSKNCLPGTREDVLSDIESWICNTEENVPRVLWLSGTAGKGKSAIAHSIANNFDQQGGVVACFCFDRTRGADRLHEKMFITIARDLADCNPIMRRELVRAVHRNNELRHTADIARQWQKLIVGPAGTTPKRIGPPVLIIIEALDESGDAHTRKQILRLLAGNPDPSSVQPSQLPAHFRIIITSRPLCDIGDALRSASHVRHISMDKISVESTEHDIQLYISTLLKGPRITFEDEEFRMLARKADGLFEWARLACEYIMDTNTVGPGPMERFHDMVAGTSDKGSRLLDGMYASILAQIMPEDDHKESLPIFREVMGKILALAGPLHMPALMAYFPDRHHIVESVLRPLSSLVTGITDPQTPLRPLHPSFYEFLRDKSRSHNFFVDVSAVHGDTTTDLNTV